MAETDFWAFPELKTCDELEKYIGKRKDGHKKYYHYTNTKAINNILKGKCIYLSSVKRFNDKCENFPKVKAGNTDFFTNQYYSLCFTTGKNENLSLWYLYSGIKGNGGRIELTKYKVKLLIENSKYELWKYDENGSPSIKVADLNPQKDVTVKLQDVIYAHPSTDPKYFDLKYNTMTNYNKVAKSEFEKYKKNNVGFVKGLIWYYEKEARVLATLSEEIFSALDENSTYVIKLFFNDKVFKNIQITFAPEIESVEDVCKEFASIDDFRKITFGLHLSEYSGDIAMGLFDEEKYRKECCEKCSEKGICKICKK